MKFVCDRCKTRYSIGDDRVRGKILKIRCKNCANVITVREGMSVADDAPEPVHEGGSTRTPKKTTLAPAAAHSAPAPAAKPPAALDEEWYVSIDGEQSGPFSLADAQRWIAGKPFDAELHCWSEGFDDWLPVDKVSHFRGLRKKPAQPPAPAPPPVPRVQHRVDRSPRPQSRGPAADVEDEPKPLFAATMASLESAAAPARPKATPPAGVPSMVAGQPGPATPGIAAKGNGKTPLPMPGQGSTAKDAPRPTTRPGVGSSTGPAAVSGFDAPPTEDDASSTHIDAPAFDDRAPGSAKASAPLGTPTIPAAMGGPMPTSTYPSPASTFPSPASTFPSSMGGPMPSPIIPARLDAPIQPVTDPPSAPMSSAGDDDMEIGEVSRVVNLADLSRVPRKERTQPVRRPQIGRHSAPVMKLDPESGAMLGGGPTGSVPPADPNAAFPAPYPGAPGGYPDASGGGLGLPDQAIAAEVPLAPAPQVTHRRSMIALLVVALLLVGGAGAVVVYILVTGSDTTPVTLAAHDDHINDERPDETIHRVFPNDTPAPGSAAPEHPQPIYHPHPNIPTNPINPDHGSGAHDDGPNGPLKPDEVEDMYTRSNTNTQRCWQRAQNKDPYIVKDVKRVVVTLSITGEGGVAKADFVGLPTTEAGTGLGACLQSMIRNWRFRQTKDGLTAKITMAFQ
nr:GYF domain-containing protein [Kofleriaceae bacterium]